MSIESAQRERISPAATAHLIHGVEGGKDGIEWQLCRLRVDISSEHLCALFSRVWDELI
jgi:hypothetical protein